MSLNDPLANVLSTICCDEKLGRTESLVRPSSKIIKKVLDVLKKHKYITGYRETDKVRGGTITIKLSGNINKCGVIKPRYSVKKNEFEKFEERYLLAKDMGLLILTTPSGIMTHHQAKEKGIGGKLIAYCY